jgi:hypothetical protein
VLVQAVLVQAVLVLKLVAPVAGELTLPSLPVPGDFAGVPADAELDVEPAGADGDEDDLGTFALAVLPDGHGVLDPAATLGPEGWLTGGALVLTPGPGARVPLVGDGDPLGGAELVGGGVELTGGSLGLGLVEPGPGPGFLAAGVVGQLAGVTVAPAE